MSRPLWIAFDLNGTLLDPAALLPDEHAELARVALDVAVLQAMTDTLTGAFRPFPDHLRAALERGLRDAGLGDDLLEAAIQRARALPAFPGAASALRTLSAAGYRVAVVTNSAAASARSALAAAGPADLVEMVVGADEVQVYKPHPDVYAHAAARLQASPGEVCLVAAHAWDVVGAHRAGWPAVWTAHREHHVLATVPDAVMRGDEPRRGRRAPGRPVRRRAVSPSGAAPRGPGAAASGTAAPRSARAGARRPPGTGPRQASGRRGSSWRPHRSCGRP